MADDLVAIMRETWRQLSQAPAPEPSMVMVAGIWIQAGTGNTTDDGGATWRTTTTAERAHIAAWWDEALASIPAQNRRTAIEARND